MVPSGRGRINITFAFGLAKFYVSQTSGLKMFINGKNANICHSSTNTNNNIHFDTKSKSNGLHLGWFHDIIITISLLHWRINSSAITLIKSLSKNFIIHV